MNDPLLKRVDDSKQNDDSEKASGKLKAAPSRQRYTLKDDTGFDEVPKKYRRFYRRWQGPGDSLAPNEVICPVCKVVIRSARELWVGDGVYCMPCMSRLTVTRGSSGRLEATVVY